MIKLSQLHQIGFITRGYFLKWMQEHCIWIPTAEQRLVWLVLTHRSRCLRCWCTETSPNLRQRDAHMHVIFHMLSHWTAVEEVKRAELNRWAGMCCKPNKLTRCVWETAPLFISGIFESKIKRRVWGWIASICVFLLNLNLFKKEERTGCVSVRDGWRKMWTCLIFGMQLFR